ncbi:hypothetical protein B6U74_04670 [Candidatus Bathyarchaeota archaeon ex4484_205]|nr:MAG: hypothetical protein B6U74_04670 [Candidatus Bathyarchaeota archaeon ex4484_205]
MSGVIMLEFLGPWKVVVLDSPSDLSNDLKEKVKERYGIEKFSFVKCSSRMGEEEVLEVIRREAEKRGLSVRVYFDESLGSVIIESKKEFLGEEFFLKTGWRPIFKYPSYSGIVRKVRSEIHEQNGRYSFLLRIGRRIRTSTKRYDMLPRVSFLGGCREVGRSSSLVQTEESSVLVDYGISPSDYKYPHHLPELKLEEIDALILTHAHLDHAGGVFRLYSMGYDGPIYATEATISLMRLLALDLYKIGRDKIGFEKREIDRAIRKSIPIEYREEIDVAPDVSVELFDAGHIPGSSSVLLKIKSNGKEKRFLFTGDINTKRSKLLEGADRSYPELDFIAIESTYSMETHPSRKKEEKKLIKAVLETYKRGGSSIVPSFGVGRGQEILLILQDYRVDIPIFVDGMIREATKIIQSHPEFLARDLRTENISWIWREKHREEAISERGIIVTTSGMLSGGPVIRYLKELGGDERNSIIITGYQAEGTLGRKILDGERKIRVDNENIELKAEVVEVTLSAHVDRPELFEYLKNCGKPKVFTVHGERGHCEKFASEIRNKIGLSAVAPRNGDAYVLGD